MTLKEFKKLKQYLDEITGKMRDEALSEGVDISSKEFDSLTEKLKERFLARKGIELRTYNEMERSIDEGEELAESEIIYFPKMAKKIKDNSKKREAELNEYLENIKRDSDIKFDEMDNRVKDVLTEILETRKGALTADDVQKIAKGEIPEFPKLGYGDIKHDDFDHINIIKDLNVFENQIKEFKDSVAEARANQAKESKNIVKQQKELNEDLDLIGEALAKIYEEKN